MTLASSPASVSLCVNNIEKLRVGIGDEAKTILGDFLHVHSVAPSRET